MRIIMQNGYASFNGWVSLGYPGAKSFPKEDPVEPDRRRGLCTHPVGCDNVTAGNNASARLGLCSRHHMELRRKLREASKSA